MIPVSVLYLHPLFILHGSTREINQKEARPQTSPPAAAASSTKSPSAAGAIPAKHFHFTGQKMEPGTFMHCSTLESVSVTALRRLHHQ